MQLLSLDISTQLLFKMLLSLHFWQFTFNLVYDKYDQTEAFVNSLQNISSRLKATKSVPGGKKASNCFLSCGKSLIQIYTYICSHYKICDSTIVLTRNNETKLLFSSFFFS